MGERGREGMCILGGLSQGQEGGRKAWVLLERGNIPGSGGRERVCVSFGRYLRMGREEGMCTAGNGDIPGFLLLSWSLFILEVLSQNP